MGRHKVKYEGKEVLGEDITFRIVQDSFMKLELEDGAVLTVRPVVINVLKTEERTTEGERVYVLQSFVHVNLATPSKGDQT